MDIVRLIERNLGRVLPRNLIDRFRRSDASAPARLCPYGHEVFSGNNVCNYGHHPR